MSTLVSHKNNQRVFPIKIIVSFFKSNGYLFLNLRQKDQSFGYIYIPIFVDVLQPFVYFPKFRKRYKVEKMTRFVSF